jgi:glutathione S-transferase
MPSLTLYFVPGASSMAAHIALHEVGVAFDARPLALGETRGDAFRAVNPEGLVPTLLIDGRRLTEVAGILYYLARAFPDARLFPDDNEAQAQVVSWMSFVASRLHPVTTAFNQAAQEPERMAARERLWRTFGLANDRLGAGPWAVGDYSIADIHLFRLYWRMWHSAHPDKEEFPHLAAHYDRMLARPAVRRTIENESAIGYQLRNFTPRDGFIAAGVGTEHRKR